jgi:formate dehydrogenase major subunit
MDGPVRIVKGDAANNLISFVADPNTSIQESKALTGNIEPGRRSRGPRMAAPVLVPPGVVPESRDLPVVAVRPVGKHGVRAARSQEGEET